MTTPWSHLPNAEHIDRVLTSLKAYPEKWCAARQAAWDAAWNAAWNESWEMVSDTTIETAWREAKDVAWYMADGVARYGVWNLPRNAAWDAARGAIFILIMYDCAYMLDSNVGELKIIAAFGDPRAILLLPACIVFSETKDMISV